MPNIGMNPMPNAGANPMPTNVNPLAPVFAGMTNTGITLLPNMSQPGSVHMVNNMPVLDRATFDSQLKLLLEKNNIEIDPKILVIDTKEINLYDLHLEVLAKGGSTAVSGSII
jgi:hypothetical protein